MKKKREEMKREQKRLTREVRNKNRVRQRLKEKARTLTTENLIELLAMKAEKQKKEARQGKGKESDRAENNH